MPIASCALSGGVPGIEQDYRLLVQSVRLALSLEGIVVVVVDQNQYYDVKAALGVAHLSHTVTVLSAGVRASRSACLAKAVSWLLESESSAPGVLVHDPARPLATAGLWQELARCVALGVDAALATTAVVDSVKEVDRQGIVCKTVDRARLRAVEFPRALALDVLRRGLTQAGDGGFDEVAFVVENRCAIEILEVDRSVFAASLV